MPSYFVAKTPNGKFVGQYELGQFHALVRSGEISLDDTVIESIGTYAEVVRHGNAMWMTVLALLAQHPDLKNHPLELPPAPSEKGRWRKIAAGFATVVATGVLPALLDHFGLLPVPKPPDNYHGVYIGPLAVFYTLFEIFGLPLLAIVIAIAPRTRSFGLGMLLACGLGWLVLLSICGGLWN